MRASVQRDPSVRADERSEAHEVVPRVDVLAQAGEIEPAQPETVGTARAVERAEVTGISERDRVRRAVTGRDKRGRRSEKRVQLVRR